MQHAPTPYRIGPGTDPEAIENTSRDQEAEFGRLRERVVRIVRFHMVDVGRGDELRARRMLARFGEGLALDLLEHKEADLVGKGAAGGRTQEVERLRAFRRLVERERVNPHHLSDLAVDGADLIELGYRPGPELGRTLHELLRIVVEDPTLNRRETLLDRAREMLPR